LTPASLARANTLYTVELYDKTQHIGTQTISWSQDEINVKTIKALYFPVSSAQAKAFLYATEDITKTFSIKVHQ
jgi:hypothetical protein